MSRLNSMRETGALLAQTTQAEFVQLAEDICRENNVDELERMALYSSLTFLADWSSGGAQVYELQHSVAALLAATRAPEVDWAFVPHSFFVIKVPSQFAPTDLPEPDTIISVSAPLRSIGLARGATSIEWFRSESLNEEDSEQAVVAVSTRRQWRVVLRLAANAIAYITTHRECVSSPPVGKRHSAVHTVTAPKDIVIDRAFRDAVARLVAAGSVAEMRRALSHVVRGHWRNQAVGPNHSQRRLTWVRPHRRGDEAVGRVVSRLERIKAPTGDGE